MRRAQVQILPTVTHHEIKGLKVVKVQVSDEATFLDIQFDPVNKSLHAIFQVPEDARDEIVTHYYLCLEHSRDSIMLLQRNRGAYIGKFQPAQGESLWLVFNWHTNEFKPGELDDE